jgi:hypothetical protein
MARKAPWEGHRPLLQASWSLIRERANTGKSVAPSDLRKALWEIDPTWRDDELSIAGDLTQYAKVRLIEMGREAREAKQQGPGLAELQAEKRDLVRHMRTIGDLFKEIYTENHPYQSR